MIVKKQKEIIAIENINITIEQILSLYDYLEGDNFINNELNELKEEKYNQYNKIITDSDEILNDQNEEEEKEKEKDGNSNDNSNDEEREEDNDSNDDNNPDSDRE